VIGVFAGWRGNVINAGEGVAGRVWQTGQPLTVDDYPAWEGRSPRLTGLYRALLGVPLTSEDQVVGVIGLGYVEEGRTFGPQEIELLTGFARLASIALQNARLYRSARGEIAERARIETELRRREAVLRAVAVAAERFLSEGAWEGAIQEVLAALGGAAEVSRVYVFENVTADDGETAATMRFEWAAPGVTPEIDNPAMRPFAFRRDGFARWEQALRGGEIMQANVRELPGSERPVLEAEGILSIVVVPIFLGARWAGFMGFDECRAERGVPLRSGDEIVQGGPQSRQLRRCLDPADRRRLEEREELGQTLFVPG